MKILMFKKALTQEGGAERLMLEVVRWFTRFGHDVRVVSAVGKSVTDFFGGAYRETAVKTFHEGDYPMGFFGKITVSVTSAKKLRSEIKSFKPDIVVGQNAADAEVICLASLGLKVPYAVFLYASFFNFPDDGLKYLPPFKRVFEKIRNSTPGHRTFIPFENPVRGFTKQLILRSRAWLNYAVVRRARIAFSMSRRMAWENGELYRRPVVAIVGGTNPSLLNYRPKKDMKPQYGFPAGGKMLIDVSRLIEGKRIDLCIRTVAELNKKRGDVYLAVGGKGPDKEKLEGLVAELGLGGRAVLAGFVAEEDLHDFYASAEIIFHPAWIDFDLTVMEGLSFGKKVVCSADFDTSGELEGLKGTALFSAEPNPIAMAQAVEAALQAAPVPVNELEQTLRKFTWEAYSRNLASHLAHAIKR